MAKPKNLKYIQVNGRLYERVHRYLEPETVHHLPQYRKYGLSEAGLKTTCGTEAQTGTIVKADITCKRCRAILKLKPFTYPRAEVSNP